MRNKTERERLEGLLAQIHADTSESGSAGEVCLSPMLGEPIDSDSNGPSEGDENDELFA